MNSKALFTLISLLAGSLVPAAALAERDNGFNRDKQQQSQKEEHRNRQDANRQQPTQTVTPRAEPNTTQRLRQNIQQKRQQHLGQPAAPQRVQQLQQKIHQQRAGQPAAPQRVERNTPQHIQQPRQQRVGQPASPRVERNTPQRMEQKNHRQFERPAPQRAERRVHEPRRATAPVRRHVETRRSYHIEPPREYRRHFVYRPVPRDRYYSGIHIYRHYGHRYPGFGFYYSDHDALRFLAFTVLTLAIIDHIDEHSQRLHEQAMIRATTAEIGDTVYWEDRYSHGSVTVTDIWYDRRGRECRELEQSVTARGRTESSFSTVCKKPDGIWVVAAR